MKIKAWLIHKLGGKTIEDILPPQTKLVVNRTEVLPIIAQYIDVKSCSKKEYIEDILAYQLASEIKNYMKVEKQANYYGDTYYTAKVNIVKVEE